MRLTIPSIEIPPSEPFKNDVFGRQEFAERLTNLIKNTEDDSLVISLNAQWGEGKTTFMKMLNQYLENQGATTIYFDAFAHDYVDDAFTAITGEIYSKANAKLADKEIENKFPEIAGKFLSVAAKVGTKIALNKMGLEAEDLKGIVDGTSEAVSKIIEDKIKKYDDNKASIASFKKELENLAETVKTERINEYKYPLIFIVDELDRCKPTYALDIIEKIKHFFSVKNIVFILVMNKQQMETSIKSVYGDDIEASTYLQKFVDLECVLPKQIDNINNQGAYIGSDIENYCNYLYEKHELTKIANKSELQTSMIAIAKATDLTLRELERCYTYITLFHASKKPHTPYLYILVCFLAALKVKETNFYKALKSKKIAYESLVKSVLYKNVALSIPDLPNTFLYLFKSNKELTDVIQDNRYVRLMQGMPGLGNSRDSREWFIPFLCDLIDSFEFD